VDTVTTTLRVWALHFAARGWHLLPITPSAKKPPVIDRWEARASTDPDQINYWWRQIPFSIGIATGPSRLVVVDLDTPKPDPNPGRSCPTGGPLSGSAPALGCYGSWPAAGHHGHPDLRREDPVGWVALVLHHPTRHAVTQLVTP
jgi:hypothetical protein